MSTDTWFDVDRDGLRKLIEHRGKAIVLFELVQNAWDTNAKKIDITLVKHAGRPLATLIIEDDDPNGFADLRHAYTLFAESGKKTDPTKRGRFNLGEKLALALCKSASVVSTTGAVAFLEDGTRQRTKHRTERGSKFEAQLRMNADEFAEFEAAFHRLIPPAGTTTTLNGVQLAHRTAVCTFSVQLPTLVSNADGELTKTRRIAPVSVYEPRPGETASIYEMGLPVVETGDKYHVCVGQKIPLNMDRDNVTPAYLTAVRTAVLNHMAEQLTPTEATEAWVTDALGSADVMSAAVETAMTARFGERRAIYDPSDREATMNLVAQGYNVVSGSSLPAAVWDNVRHAGAMVPAGRIAPTPRPYSTDPGAPEVQRIPREKWTDGMRQVYDITRWVAEVTEVQSDLHVEFVTPSFANGKWAACFGAGLHWNVTTLGKAWFDNWPQHLHKLLDIILHELAHSRADNHLDEDFHKACTALGGKLATAAILGAKMPHLKLVKGTKHAA